ncbi:MAG: hypothetical protein UW81_C0012G0008 [Candidatus Giovannonibacteria bacterium GW2011_GWC2_44_9]|uniref:tRNA threonylcarbamoyladenosine biosynthesis protein TsaE n=3 Tax=Candidatus Giovannoniibacteriota TaxID=1752738 RepID=A0A0G1IWE8_9BACT|nr:MAG: hypothetical protein UW49_C0010G0021 [Candidatus Giovannonibacteria bacterium GW2011_GWB1_44_23]KKT63420.1 MAG: hypothetical protein UW57_C0007G0008 [Candidatus Giovannonibacteria bacterium GW2011_GWA1_44_29]KKT83719.1 MAG: hypothetical protein UW81_C0012G0008 [Candidatus Giovannonibacteria bacterium GW2011_GWC2_44_9]KKT91470.1 MAG: hypothetical protein UW93_C0006G0021 [Parcubacteria group bacterium GW2011_GWC1_45_13]
MWQVRSKLWARPRPRQWLIYSKEPVVNFGKGIQQGALFFFLLKYNINMKIEIFTKSDKETKKLGKVLAREILKTKSKKRAVVISLGGELGSGKTTFTQGFAKGLGVRETPRSPTFVIMQIYRFRTRNLVHVDAYRLNSRDFRMLNWDDFIKNPQNIILVEWGNKIKNILPKNSVRIIFKHIGRPRERLIKIFI